MHLPVITLIPMWTLAVAAIPCSPGQYFPHKDNCSLYYICGQDQIYYLYECPAGLHFRENSSTCDLPERASCKVLTTIEVGDGLTINRTEEEKHTASNMSSDFDIINQEGGNFLISEGTGEQNFSSTGIGMTGELERRQFSDEMNGNHQIMPSETVEEDGYVKREAEDDNTNEQHINSTLTVNDDQVFSSELDEKDVSQVEYKTTQTEEIKNNISLSDRQKINELLDSPLTEENLRKVLEMAHEFSLFDVIAGGDLKEFLEQHTIDEGEALNDEAYPEIVGEEKKSETDYVDEETHYEQTAEGVDEATDEGSS